MRSSDLWKNVILAVLVTISTLEVASWFAIRVLASRGFIYVAGQIEESAVRDYLERRDPVIGWSPPVSSADEVYNELGARRSPVFSRSAETACVATYGDSFTFGADVAPGDAYPNQLAELLGCPVNNYGVPGYGTDQALLRFRTKRDEATVVVLGHHSVDVVRNVNRYRNFLGGAVGIGFKPRFVVRDGVLELVPMPGFRSVEAISTLGRNSRALEHEFFYPGGPSGQVRAAFPYMASLAAFAFNWRVRARLAGVPPYAPFYHPEHPSNALEVTAAIIAAFDREARERGQSPVVLLLPGDKDLLALQRGLPLFYQPLIDALEEMGIPVPGVARAMMEFLEEHDVCDAYINCQEHYTPAGNRVVARVVQRWISEHGLRNDTWKSSVVD